MSFVNNLPRKKQIEVIAALCEGVGIRTAARLTGVNRGTVGTLALRVGLGCMELHDRLMVGIREGAHRRCRDIAILLNRFNLMCPTGKSPICLSSPTCKNILLRA